ncbi:MAG: UDP-N-acetylmuramoyl-L-alanyl-D-glutamate--2,6-diaminopimelate ligase [Kiritimatiellia bacterium]
MRLKSLLDQIGCTAAENVRDLMITGVTCDSRQVQSGHIFVALKGQRQNGQDFAEDAISRGAIALVTEDLRSPNRGVCHIRVPDARLAFAELAAAFHDYPSRKLRVLGVTGTNGKTTICYMMRDLLQAQGLSPGMIGTVQYEIGSRVIPASRTTPEAGTLQSLLGQMVNAGCKSVAMEVSSHALAQQRVASVEFDVAVFTNLTHDHLDYHQTVEQYYEAKATLFRSLGRGPKEATAVINIDCPWGRRLVSEIRGRVRVLTYGFNQDAEVSATDIHVSTDGSFFAAVTPWGTFPLRIPHLGRFNVGNALAAFTACAAIGLSPERLAGIFPALQRVPGRLEEIECARGYRVFVDYAHTDDALRNVLTALREIIQGRIILVFGCGGNRDKTKRRPMGEVAATLADFSVITTDNPRNESPAVIIEDIRKGFGTRSNYAIVPDRREAIRAALNNAKPGDLVLIAGKGHETFQEFANTIIPFDDRQVVKEILGSN